MRRLWVMLFATLLVSACSTTPDKPEQSDEVIAEMVKRQVDLGVAYVRNGDFIRAKEKLNRALDLDPKNASVHQTFGILFQLEGEDALAEQHFQDAIKFEPDNAQSRNSYGAFLFSNQRYHEAVKQLSIASENRFYPNRPAVFENLGVAYMRIGDVENAEFSFTRSIQLNPDQPRALLELAEIRFDQRNYVQARDLYRKHTNAAPKSPKTLWLCIRLARIFRDQNEEASCIEALEGIFPASEEYRKYQESL